uniref:Uncharacterized protein n=1 Tax=Nelumbo nucifera TaxID=4432 RepID=A0A822YN15_NELNU|nr:TPA_asm: hypothetical protein HUJ06_006204 [Nelumbo nucifera]
MKEDPLQKAGDWFEGLSRLYGPRRVLSLATSLYRIICDKNDNWQAGAIATLIDLVGVAVIKVSFSDGDVKVVTVDFSVSYFSTIKIHKWRLKRNWWDTKRSFHQRWWRLEGKTTESWSLQLSYG